MKEYKWQTTCWTVWKWGYQDYRRADTSGNHDWPASWSTSVCIHAFSWSPGWSLCRCGKWVIDACLTDCYTEAFIVDGSFNETWTTSTRKLVVFVYLLCWERHEILELSHVILINLCNTSLQAGYLMLSSWTLLPHLARLAPFSPPASLVLFNRLKNQAYRWMLFLAQSCQCYVHMFVSAVLTDIRIIPRYARQGSKQNWGHISQLWLLLCSPCEWDWQYTTRHPLNKPVELHTRMVDRAHHVQHAKHKCYKDVIPYLNGNE